MGIAPVAERTIAGTQIALKWQESEKEPHSRQGVYKEETTSRKIQRWRVLWM